MGSPSALVSYMGSIDVDREFSADVAWSELIGDVEVFSKEGNASKIQSPRDRMLHAFLTCTLTFRGSSTHKVSREDLFLLWCYKKGHPVNAAGWIMSRIHKTALKDKGDIMVGGFVTSIARHFGVVPTEEDEDFRVRYEDQRHGIGAKALEGARVVEKLRDPDQYGRAQYRVIGAGEPPARQAQAPEGQRPAEPARPRRHRAGSRRPSADQEASMTEMMATVMESMTSGFAGLRTHMDEGFQSLGARIYRLEERFDAFIPPAPPSHPASASYPPAPEFDPTDPDTYTDQ